MSRGIASLHNRLFRRGGLATKCREDRQFQYIARQTTACAPTNLN